MKTNYNRDWLESYKTNPRKDNSIYKNYQNPSMTKWDTQMGTLSPAQKGRYEQFINTIPDEVRGLSAPDMQRYLQGVNEKQEVLGKERAGYDTQIQNLKAQEQARIRAQQAAAAEAQRQAQLSSQQAAQAEAQRQAQLRAQVVKPPPSVHDQLTNNANIMYKYWHPSKQNAFRSFWESEAKWGGYGLDPSTTRSPDFSDYTYAKHGFPKGSYIIENTNNRNSPYYDKSKWG